MREVVILLHIRLIVERNCETFEVPALFPVACVAIKFDTHCASVAAEFLRRTEVEDVLLHKNSGLSSGASPKDFSNFIFWLLFDFLPSCTVLYLHKDFPVALHFEVILVRVAHIDVNYVGIPVWDWHILKSSAWVHPAHTLKTEYLSIFKQLTHVLICLKIINVHGTSLTTIA